MTKQFEKKLQFFKDYVKNKYNKEVIESENGNYYAYLDNWKEVSKYYNSYNITKATVHKIGEVFVYPNSDRQMLMLTKKSTFKYFHKFWRGINKHMFPELYYYNRKCSWVRNESEFDMKICEQFKSLEEFKVWLGYSFLSDNDFRKIYKFFANDLFKKIDECKRSKILLVYYKWLPEIRNLEGELHF